MSGIAGILSIAPVIPVLVVDDPARAVPLARSLVAGGLRVLEVTLRTPRALEVIRAMRSVEGAVVGAGTVLDGDQLDAATDAGAEFAVSPGLAAELAGRASAAGLPYLPGVATASDLMRGRSLGLTHFKFFPASTSGGVAGLKALAAPFRDCVFCPTGGIGAAEATEWLGLPFVACVGGSWVAQGDDDGIEARARAASGLRSPATR